MNIFAISLLALALLFVPIGIYLYKKKHRARYLVFSSAGDRNNVQSWVSDPARKNFDLVIYYYGEKNNPVFDADLIVKRKGLKFVNFHHFLKHNDISQYESIWVVDDDIIMDTESINRMFNIFSDYKLKLAQPSFSKESIAPWGITQNDPGCILRYTNFVENGVALFSTKIIPLVMGSFRDARSGFGVDYIWPSLLDFPTDKIAVIDAVSCQHPDADYSELDEVIPRHLHKHQGAELLIKYGLLPDNWQATEENPWPKPYAPVEYSKVTK